MKTKKRMFAGITLTFIFLAVAGISFAQWNPNTSVNLLISGLPTADMQSVSTSDGKTWIAFYHENSGNYDMRAQLIDANGFKLLGADGVLVSNATSGSATYVFNVCVDASNNLIIGFQHMGLGSMNAVVHKISQAGAQLWGASGIVLGPGMVPYPAALSNGEVIVAWNEETSNTTKLQKITTSGTTAWTTPISILVGTTSTTRCQLIGNLAGKFTAVYQAGGMSTTLYAQHFNNNGTAVYSPLQISSQATAPWRYYSIAAQGDTTYYGYYASVGMRFNSFLQRINPAGTIPWGLNGSNFNTNTSTFDDYQMETRINVASGSNFVWSVCTFSDYNQNNYGVYVQKFLKTTGARQLTNTGKVVYAISANDDRQAGELALINDTPMLMSYDASQKIYATRLDANGNFVWPGNRVELSSTTPASGKMRFGFTPDGPNRCAGSWTEDRGSGYYGYAQGISVGGLIAVVVATQGGVPAVITTNGGTLQMVATVIPATANQSVAWSIVPGTGAATISPSGLVTAQNNGTVWAKAVAVQDNTVKDSLLITISNQIVVNPVVVTNPATNIGLTSATLNGSVTANLYPTTVTFEWGTSTSYGSAVPATPGTVTGNSPVAVSANLTSLTQNVTYHYRCVGVSTAGTFYGADQLFTPGCPPVGAAGTISGPASVCINATGKVYSIAPVTNATAYTWTVPAGATIVSGQNTTSITVNFGNTGGTISVYGSNFCMAGAAGNLTVAVVPPPVPTISGPTTGCQGGGNQTYTTESGMTAYVWTVSAGGNIVNGAGTSQVQISWNAPGAQWVSVNYTGTAGCAATNPTTLAVTLDPLPSTPGDITGTSVLCGGASGVAYSVAPVTNATTYVWSLPPGASIASGFNTNSITVNYAGNASSGNITVQGNNLCGLGPASPPFPVTVNPLPADPGIISGLIQVCQGMTGVNYSVAPIANAVSYNWAVPSGATVTGGANTSSILVDFGPAAVSGNVSVFGTNTCGNGNISELPVSVGVIPPAPVITANGPELSSNAPAGNQWYHNGSPVPGATAPNYTATLSGWYWDVVTLEGCASDTSNHLYVEVTGIGETSALPVHIYPVPNSGIFNLSIPGSETNVYQIKVINTLGAVIYASGEIRLEDKTPFKVDIQGAAPGLYSVVVMSAKGRSVREIVVTRD